MHIITCWRSDNTFFTQYFPINTMTICKSRVNTVLQILIKLDRLPDILRREQHPPNQSKIPKRRVTKKGDPLLFRQMIHLNAPNV